MKMTYNKRHIAGKVAGKTLLFIPKIIITALGIFAVTAAFYYLDVFN